MVQREAWRRSMILPADSVDTGLRHVMEALKLMNTT